MKSVTLTYGTSIDYPVDARKPSKKTQWLFVAQELFAIQEELKRLEKIAGTLKNDLKELSDNKSMMVEPFSFVCDYRAGSVNYAAIPQLKGINLEAFRKESVEIWKLIKIAKS